MALARLPRPMPQVNKYKAGVLKSLQFTENQKYNDSNCEPSLNQLLNRKTTHLVKHRADKRKTSTNQQRGRVGSLELVLKLGLCQLFYELFQMVLVDITAAVNGVVVGVAGVVGVVFLLV